jgi:hypothetical protein
MAEYERTPREHEVDVLPAIDIPDVRTFTPRRDNGLASNASKGAHWRIHTARKQLTRARHDLRGLHSTLWNGGSVERAHQRP